MKQSSYKAYEDFPLFLNANDLSSAIGIAPSSCYEMMPEEVDRAVESYMHRVADKTVLNLSITIFLSLILGDKIIDLMYRFYEHGEIPVDAYVTVTLELTA